MAEAECCEWCTDPTDPRGGGLEEKGEDKGTEGTASCIFLPPLFLLSG